MVRGMADRAAMQCVMKFSAWQAHGIGLFLDEMVNTFDPDALIIGGGALKPAIRFANTIEQVRVGMPTQREEQADILST